MTDLQKFEITFLYYAGGMSFKELAARYNTTRATIANIIKRN